METAPFNIGAHDNARAGVSMNPKGATLVKVFDISTLERLGAFYNVENIYVALLPATWLVTCKGPLSDFETVPLLAPAMQS